jgi:DNA (cytosine-5)-methyltransferase 1
VRTLRSLPRGIDLVAAGFPCQDLSSVGQKAGIAGARSALVREVFRLIASRPTPWVILENVPFLLQLGAGRALDLVTTELSRLGYAWAYRVIDSQAFGLPQRRRRWYLVASRVSDPRNVLLAGDAVLEEPTAGHACGFYWTEGTRALGWAVDAVPPLKGGSTVGVPSPPAILLPDGQIVTPDLRDAERLQGFPSDWTRPAEKVARRGYRWLLVGNAVSVNVASWLGRRLRVPARYDASADEPWRGNAWPAAAWSLGDGRVFRSSATVWPTVVRRAHLVDFLRYPTQPLSERAAKGFLKRAEHASLRFPPGFLETVKAHIATQQDRASADPTKMA